MKRIKIWWLFVVVWMLIIFYMSHQPGDISSTYSMYVVKLCDMFKIPVTSVFGEAANFIIRKVGHFTEYLVLGVLLMNAFGGNNTKRNFLFTFGICILYAIMDEVHQLFIPGRVGAIQDVLIDSCGSIFGCLILYIRNRKKEVY